MLTTEAPELRAAATSGRPARRHDRRAAAGGAQPEPGYDATRAPRSGRATRPSGAATPRPRPCKRRRPGPVLAGGGLPHREAEAAMVGEPHGRWRRRPDPGGSSWVAVASTGGAAAAAARRWWSRRKTRVRKRERERGKTGGQAG